MRHDTSHKECVESSWLLAASSKIDKREWSLWRPRAILESARGQWWPHVSHANVDWLVTRATRIYRGKLWQPFDFLVKKEHSLLSNCRHRHWPTHRCLGTGGQGRPFDKNREKLYQRLYCPSMVVSYICWAGYWQWLICFSLGDKLGPNDKCHFKGPGSRLVMATAQPR